MTVHDFTFDAKSDAGPVTIHGGKQVGAFAVAPSFADMKNAVEHTVMHWPTGYALCRCVDFELAMVVADDASRFAAVSVEALELDVKDLLNKGDSK